MRGTGTDLTVFLSYWFNDVLVVTFSVLSRRARKSGEKNVKAVKKSEEVEGYEGDKDVNTLLRVSLFQMLTPGMDQITNDSNSKCRLFLKIEL